MIRRLVLVEAGSSAFAIRLVFRLDRIAPDRHGQGSLKAPRRQCGEEIPPLSSL